MSDTSSGTRSDLLDAAEALVLERGLAGATVDAIVGRAGVSKGAFFHHFSGKAELGRILVQRQRERERVRLEEAFGRANRASEDPLVRVLVALTVLEDGLREDGLRTGSGDAASPPAALRGSLLGSVAAQPEAFGDEALEAAREGLEERRSLLAARLEEAARSHPLPGGTDPEELAGTFVTILEGSRLLAQLVPDDGGSRFAARRLADFRFHLELLFGVPASGGNPT